MAKTTQPLSASQVSALKAKSSTYTVGDGRGLFIRVGATGRKSWVFRYKKPTTGKTTNWAFAPYPQKSLADARAMAEDYRAILADDRCPQESTAQQIDKAAVTFERVTREWMEHHGTMVEADTLTDIRRAFENHVLPHIGQTPIIDLRAPDAIKALGPLAAAGKLETVKRISANLRKVMFFAMNRGYVDSNTLESITDFYPKPTPTPQATIHPSQLPELMQRLDGSNAKVQTKRAIQLLLHLMVRPVEATSLRWDYIDFDEGLITIPAAVMKMKRDHVVPMSHQVTDILLEQREAVHEDNPWVFPGDRDRAKPMSSQSPNALLRRIGYESGELCSHGFRSLATDSMLEAGHDPQVVDKMLAHVRRNDGTSASFSAYARTTLLEKRRVLAQWWSDEITSARVEGITKGSRLRAVK